MTVAIVAGAMSTKAGNGGNAWTRLGWVEGLRAVGFDVWFLEQAPAGGLDQGALAWLAAVADEHGIADRVLVFDQGGRTLVGPADLGAAAVAAEARLLLDISGHLGDALPFGGRCVRAFLDDDPGFTQFWELAGDPGSRLGDHDLHLTYGTNIGRPGCAIPTVGRRWHAIVPPVSLDDWAVDAAPSARRFTTVGSWRGPFGPVEHEGVTYGVKVHEFRKILDLPARVEADFDVALAIDPAETTDLEALARFGWQLSDPRTVAATPSAYRQWVVASGAEISAAQGVYVGTRSGWVSDRTACYLSAGRPALVQDTGQQGAVPVGEGLLTFDDAADAAAKAEVIMADHDRHARAARALAEELFDARRVAAQLCELAQVGP